MVQCVIAERWCVMRDMMQAVRVMGVGEACGRWIARACGLRNVRRGRRVRLGAWVGSVLS